MPLIIVRSDITKMEVDAIVSAANPALEGGGGVNGAIHRAAGPEFDEACRSLGGCRMGEAKLTAGYGLPAKYVIHTVGPIWRGGGEGEGQILTACYQNALELAVKAECRSVAFPLISAGAFGFPKELALRTAENAIVEFLKTQELTVYIVVFDRESYDIGKARFKEIAEYIDDRYAEAHGGARDALLARRNAAAYWSTARPEAFGAPCAQSAPQAMASANMAPAAELPKQEKKSRGLFKRRRRKAEKQDEQTAPPAAPFPPQPAPQPLYEEQEAGFADAQLDGLRDWLDETLDESFSEMLLRKIDEKNMTDAECYKKANIDRKLFSKIRSDRLYKPSKPTVLAFAIALELSLNETKTLLMKAGFALSHASKFDIIIEYFIERGNYNIFEINEALFAFDQSLLGA